MIHKHALSAAVIALGLAVASLGAQQDGGRPPDENGAFRFKSGVELINVTATVSDASGRFVPGLRKEDFAVYEDDQPVEITHFSAERVPVSLGIVLDTSGSMAGDKIQEAQSALDRFLFDLLDNEDEIFLYRFSNYPVLLQGWTTDRAAADARARADPARTAARRCTTRSPKRCRWRSRARTARRRCVVISDGNDTGSQTDIRELKQQIRESEVLVYAIGIDGEAKRRRTDRRRHAAAAAAAADSVPVSGPGGRGATADFPLPLRRAGEAAAAGAIGPGDDRVNVAALRDMTDDSGGRTEIVRDAARSQSGDRRHRRRAEQAVLPRLSGVGKKDGRWHSIRVEVRSGRYTVRARKGYVAS